jgi:predicted RNA binding protein YcfA (HicA-like mRNA interferase family)
MPGRKRKKGAKLSRGPFTSRDIERELGRIGYKFEAGGKHRTMRHPDRPGKVSVSPGWTGVKAGSVVFRSIARQAGMSKKDLQRVLNGLDPDPPKD